MNFSRLAPLHFPPPVSSNNPYRLFHEIGQNYGYAYSSRRWIAKKIQKASIEKASFFSILALRPLFFPHTIVYTTFDPRLRNFS